MDQARTRLSVDSPSVPAIERRGSARVELRVSVGFSTVTNFFAGLSEDVSEGGLFVATHALEPIGTELKLRFVLPGEHEVVTSGVVRWVRDPHDQPDAGMPGMGIAFGELRPADAAIIREFIARREPIFFEP